MFQTLLNHLSGLLKSSHPPTQFAAYNLLSTALPAVMEQWEMNEITVREEDDTPPRPLPYPLMAVITQVLHISLVFVAV